MEISFFQVREDLVEWARYYVANLRKRRFAEKLPIIGPKALAELPGTLASDFLAWTSIGRRIVEVGTLHQISERTFDGKPPRMNMLSLVKHLAITPEYLFVQVFGPEAYIIPRSAFKDADSREAFIAEMLKEVPAGVVRRLV